MWRKLVEWIVGVHHVTDMSPSTLHTAVHCLGKYMRVKDVGIEEFQMIGIVSLLVSCKANDSDHTEFGVRYLNIVCLMNYPPSPQYVFFQ